MAPHHILVVEDDRNEREAFVELLESAGHAVTAVDSAEAALDLLQVQSCDLVVADYQLGGATGAWLARIAARSVHAPPQTLLVTGHSHLADTDGLTVVPKPIDVRQFLAAVERALTAPHSLEGIPAGPAQRIAFVLYVNDSVASRRAMTALRGLLARYDTAQVALTLVDLATHTSHQAEEHRVVVTPTLLKTFPAPRVWIAGQLERLTLVTQLLEEAGVEARS